MERYREPGALLALVAFPVVSWLAAGPALATTKTISCVSFDYPPLVTQIEGDAPSGIAVELVSDIFGKLDYSVSVKLYPWGRALKMMQTGEADCIFTVFWSADRAAFLDYTPESIVEQKMFFYRRKGSGLQFDGNLHAMQPLRIGTAHSVNYGPRFESMRPWLQIDEAQTIEQNFIKLLAGRVDVVVSNGLTADAVLRTPSLRPHAELVERIPTEIESVPTHVAFSKHRRLDALRDAFDKQFRLASAR